MGKSMDLSFLNDVKLEAVKKIAPKGRITTPKLPETADLRVYASGKVYPSKDFAKRAELEFMPKEVTEVDGTEIATIVGNGLEIFSSKDWGMVKGKMPQELIFCAPVPKILPKVDMWASTKYDENNQPKASVFTQGANTFAKVRLVPMIAEIYGVNWDETEYVDLVVMTDNVMTSDNGLYHLPKIVSTGKDQGKSDYIRRENLTICPLVIAHTQPKGSVEGVVEEAPALNESTDTDTNSVTETKEDDKDWAANLGEKETEKVED